MATSSDSNRRSKWLFIIAIISLVLCVPSLILIAKSFQTFEDHHELGTEVCINADVLDPKFLETKEGQKFFNMRKEDAQEKYCMRDANDLTNFLLSYKESEQSSGGTKMIQRERKKRFLFLKESHLHGAFDMH